MAHTSWCCLSLVTCPYGIINTCMSWAGVHGNFWSPTCQSQVMRNPGSILLLSLSPCSLLPFDCSSEIKPSQEHLSFWKLESLLRLTVDTSNLNEIVYKYLISGISQTLTFWIKWLHHSFKSNQCCLNTTLNPGFRTPKDKLFCVTVRSFTVLVPLVESRTLPNVMHASAWTCFLTHPIILLLNNLCGNRRSPVLSAATALC